MDNQAGPTHQHANPLGEPELTLCPDTPPRPPNPRAKKKRSRLALVVIIGVLGFGMLVMGGGALSLVATLLTGGAGLGNSPVTEQVVQRGGSRDADTIAVISLTGPIMGSGSHIQGQGTTHDVILQLRKAAGDPQVRAVLLQIDSPGGGLTASDLIYNEVLRVKQAGKVVVVYVGSLAASGGYYIAAPADHIVASPTSMVGSFGIILYRFQLAGLMDKIGVQPEPLKSTEMKDIGSPFRDLTEEERKFFQNLLAQYHDRFVDIIARGRGLEESAVRRLADGRIYTATEAEAHKLINEIGYADAALDKAKELAGIYEDPRIVHYQIRRSLMQMLTQSRGEVSIQSARELINALRAAETPQIQARWTGSSSVAD